MTSARADVQTLRSDVAKYEELLAQAGANSRLVRERAVVLAELGETLLQLQQYEQAAARYAEAVTIMWQFEEEHVWAAQWTGRQAAALTMLGRDRDAVNVLDGLVRRVGVGWEEPSSQVGVEDTLPIALAPWLYLLERLGLQDETYVAAESLIRAYDPPASWRQQLLVADAFEKKGSVAQARGNDSEALALFDAAIEHCPAEPDHRYVSILARALAGRGAVLEELGRTDDARAAFDELINRCDSSAGAADRKILADARASRSRLDPRRSRSWKSPRRQNRR